MAVLIEAISIVIRLETIADKYPGGVEQYIKDCPNQTLCTDEEIVRVGFMTGKDANAFIYNLKHLGFRYATDGEFDEIAVVDQIEGFLRPCDWLDFTNSATNINTNMRISACKIKGAQADNVHVPEDWDYETSLSKQALVTDNKNFNKRMIFLRHEHGVDYYLDAITGKEHWGERTAKRNLNS